MSYILYDLVIGVVLLLFALSGRKRGLVLALCSLAAIITAFVGATYVADALTPKAADVLVPKITSVIERRLADVGIIDSGSSDDGGEVAVDGNGAMESNDTMSQENIEDNQETSGGSGSSETGLTAVREAMGALKLPSGILDSVEDTLGDLSSIGELPSVLSGAIARAAADTLLHLIIFLVSFVIILLLWRLIGHALDLVARLPVLHFLNKTGGLVLGLCKGVFFLFVLAWVFRYIGNIVPADAVEHTHLLHFFMTTDPLKYITGM